MVVRGLITNASPEHRIRIDTHRKVNTRDYVSEVELRVSRRRESLVDAD